MPSNTFAPRAAVSDQACTRASAQGTTAPLNQRTSGERNVTVPALPPEDISILSVHTGCVQSGPTRTGLGGPAQLVSV